MSSEDGLRLSRPSETGRYSKRIYLVEHPQRLDASQKRQRIAQDAGGYIKHPAPEHWTGLDSTNNSTGGGKSQEYEEQQCRRSASASSGCGQTATGRQNRGIWKLAERGFSGRLSSDRLTGASNEIAENIYDWWISGKSYRQWYAERFQQLKIDFGEES